MLPSSATSNKPCKRCSLCLQAMARPIRTPASGCARSTPARATAAVRDIINLPDNGHLYAAHVIHDIWREAVAAWPRKETIIVTECRPAPDVGGAVLQARSAAFARHLGRPRYQWALRCPQPSAPRSPVPRRTSGSSPATAAFQMTARRALHHPARGSGDQHRRHQQRLPRHGAAVAGGLLRQELLGQPHPLAGLRQDFETRRRARHRGCERERAQSGDSHGYKSAHQRQALPDQLPGRKGRRASTP